MLLPLPETTIEGWAPCVARIVVSLEARGASALGDRLRFPDWYTIEAPRVRNSFIEGEFLPNKTPGVASWKWKGEPSSSNGSGPSSL